MCHVSGSTFLNIQSSSDISVLTSFLGENYNPVFIYLTVSFEWEDWDKEALIQVSLCHPYHLVV